MMFRHKASVRLTALFVVAFICLNAGGAMCVAYCQSFDVAAEEEHCPLKKLSEHCDGADDDQKPFAASFVSHSADCCPMTVSLFSAPVEKLSFSFGAVAEVPVQEFHLSPVSFLKTVS